MAGTSNSITTHNVLSGVLNADNVISGLVNTAFNPAYALVTQAGAQIVLFINSNDYKMYAQLKDKSGNLIYTSNIIDLPLETMVVDGRYDSNTKKLILVLDNGNEIEVPLEALINGLVNEDDLIANYYDKDEIDALLNGYWTKIELTQEDIDNWNAKQEYLNQGDGIEISADTILKGNTSQESTTGKNLLNVSDISDSLNNQYYKNHETGFTLEEEVTYTLSFDAQVSVTPFILTVGTGEEGYVRDMYTEGGKQNGRVSITFTPTSANLENATKLFIRCPRYNSATTTTFTLKNFQLEKSSTATSYEPYTGGNPAPSPDYPYPVNVVTGDNEVKVEGKNLFDYKQVVKGSLDGTNGEIVRADYVTINSLENNTITITTTANYRGFTSPFIKIKPNTDYTFSIGSTTLSSPIVVFCYYDENKNFISSQTQYNFNNKVINQNASYVRFSYAGSMVTNGSISNIMLEQSSTKTDYEPYQSQTYPINLGSMELCKIGDYQDYLYKENGVWYKYGAIGKWKIPNNVGGYNDEDNWYYIGLSNFNNIFIQAGATLICTHYQSVDLQDYHNVNGIKELSTHIVTRNLALSSINEYRTFYTNNDVYFYGRLATPTITEITDTTLISQLNALTTGFSNNWVKNISQTNADLPFEIEYNNKNLTISTSSNLVRDTDYATTTKAGLIRANNYYGTAMYNEYLIGVNKTYADYGTSPNNMYISKGTLENVITGKELTNKTYVDAADAVFESELFDDGIISAEDSTEANINNTMNKSQLKIDLKGNTSQESTTGKNLIPNNLASGSSSGITYTVNSDGSIKLSGTATARVEPYLYKDNNNPITFKAGTYRNTSSKMMILYADGYILAPPNQTFTLDEDKNVINIYFRIENGETVNETYYPQIILNSITDTSYEPYTGGNPAPNPEFPMPVNVVTGDNEVKVEGKNLLSQNNSTFYIFKELTIEPINAGTYTFSGNVVSSDTDASVCLVTFRNLTTEVRAITVTRGNFSTTLNLSEEVTSIRLYASTDYSKSTGDTATFSNLMISTSGGNYVPYQSQTYPITLSSKNLFSGMSSIGSSSSYENNTLTIPTSNTNISNIINVDSSTSYTLSLNSSSSSTRIYITENNANGERVNTLTSYSRPYTFTTTANTKTIDIRFSPSSSESFPITISQIMLEKGSTATEYQPYNPDPIELCKIGDYQDVIKRSSGKNLFDKNAVTTGKWLNINGELENAVSYVVSDYIELEPGETYYIPKRGSTRTKYYKADKSVYSNSWDVSDYAQAITIPIDVKYIRMSFLIAGTSAIDLDTTQFEKSSTSTTYEPYGKVWYKYGAIRKIEVNISDMNNSDDYPGWRGVPYLNGDYPGLNTATFPTTRLISNIGGNVNSFGVVTINTNSILILNKAFWNLTQTQWKTNYPNLIFVLYYVLATPTATEITDTTLIEQLDNLEKAYSYNSQTNILQTNQDKPFILDINAIANNVNGLKLENENQEYKTNKVIELSSNSTDDEYPSAKCVYDIVGNIEAVLAAMDSGSGV